MARLSGQMGQVHLQQVVMPVQEVAEEVERWPFIWAVSQLLILLSLQKEEMVEIIPGNLVKVAVVVVDLSI